MNNQNTYLKGRQRGTVLIVVLFIVALIEIALVSFATHHGLAIRHTSNYLSSLEAQNLALSGEIWATSQIIAAFKNNKPQNQWLLPLSPLKNGFIEGVVEDMQGRFNINNVQNLSTLANFNHMLSFFFPPQDQEKIEAFTASLLLQQQKTPAMSTLVSITELRTMPLMTPQIFEKMLSYFTVLPEKTPLNVNSATNYSLLSLGQQIDLKMADTIIRIRDHLKGFSSISSFLAIEPSNESTINVEDNNITISSKYYLSSIHVNYNNIDLTLHSLIKVVTANENQFTTQIIWRSFGTL